MSDYRYSIGARWRVEPASPAVLGEKFLRALEAISEAVPEIGTWSILKRPFQEGFVTIDEARAAIVELVENNVSTIDCIPEPEEGYTLIASNIWEFSPNSVTVAVRTGGRLGDTIRFRVGSAGEPSGLETATYPLFRAALLAIVTQWSCVWANAYLHIPTGYDIVSVGDPPLLVRRSRPDNISFAPDIPPHPDSSYNRPWLSYLCAPLTEGLVPPVGVPCERTADGGLLMIAAEERLDPTNSDHMRRSRAMAEVMIARAGNPPRPGWWSVEETWPSTPEGRHKRNP